MNCVGVSYEQKAAYLQVAGNKEHKEACSYLRQVSKTISYMIQMLLEINRTCTQLAASQS